MKNIELTEHHKSKLLDMCNKLFWNGCINKNDFRENNVLLIAIDKNYKYNHKILKIHWFEFCMTHLAKKIFEKTNIQTNYISEEIKKIIWNYLSNVNHPVDYLYKEFKKL